MEVLYVQKEERSGPVSPPEATPLRQVQAGDQDSLNLLLAQHEGLVRLVANRQWLGGLPYEEALQAGRHRC